MCFVFLCDEEEKELGRQQASGSCPYCGGKVQAVDFEGRWRPLFFSMRKRKSEMGFFFVGSRGNGMFETSCGTFYLFDF
ncbi:hypothetical protein NC651_015481 [Populus alba x Populus x berolinensis]|nr:hypothetical protein NC651_015481 [Populus alba x Populus x berolinensis]